MMVGPCSLDKVGACAGPTQRSDGSPGCSVLHLPPRSRCRNVRVAAGALNFGSAGIDLNQITAATSHSMAANEGAVLS